MIIIVRLFNLARLVGMHGMVLVDKALRLDEPLATAVLDRQRFPGEYGSVACYGTRHAAWPACKPSLPNAMSLDSCILQAYWDSAVLTAVDGDRHG